MKQISLHLAVMDGEIFFDYSEMSGVVFPGGSIQGITYSRLEELGTGVHSVATDPDLPIVKGASPYVEGSDDHRLLTFRFWSFLSQTTGVDTLEGWALVEAFTPGNARKLMPMLTAKHKAFLTSLAASLEADAFGQPIPPRFISAEPGIKDHPIENLLTIRSHFTANEA